MCTDIIVLPGAHGYCETKSLPVDANHPLQLNSLDFYENDLGHTYIEVLPL